MTVTGNRGHRLAAVISVAFVLSVAAGVRGEQGVLDLRAAIVGESTVPTLRVEVSRWSTDAERAPMVTALSTPPPAAPSATAPPAGTAAPATGPAPQPAAGGRGGRGGRGAAGGGRGGGAPLSPVARLSAAVKAAPTIGFVWADGPTGYSIKYAWQSASTDPVRRIVLVTDRRIGAHQPLWPSATGPSADAEFTVLEFHLDAARNGEGKTSLVSDVVADQTARTLALDKYGAAPVQLRVVR